LKGLLVVRIRLAFVATDSHGGVAAGLAAGMRVIGITTTYADLPGTSLLARDFNDPALERWLLAAQHL
jgi:beta-phosphoglucomutase-like phosphatase (HAD superfamily)